MAKTIDQGDLVIAKQNFILGNNAQAQQSLTGKIYAVYQQAVTEQEQ